MEIEVKYKDTKESVELNKTLTTEELKAKMAKIHRIPIEQIELSYVDDLKKEKKTLKDADVINQVLPKGVSLNLKNLGPQVSWRTVFLTEYGGPLIIFPLLYILGNHKSYDFLQKVLFWMVIIHFAKREFETLTVHVFSRSTMPFKRIFINSMHYWIFCGVMCGIEIFFFWRNPGYSTFTIVFFAGVWAVSQFMNFMCHVTTSNIRKAPGATETTRGIPRGWGFDLVSSANYFWEIVSWTIFAILSRTYTVTLD